MDVQLVILITSFLALLVMDVPIAIAIGISTLLTLVSLGDVPASYVVAQRMSTGIASFPLLAIPFFIFAGMLMGEGGMARRLVDFASTLVGRYRGGLAYVSTLTCMMFGAISGSAAAAVSSIGGMMIPEMTRNGYNREFSVAVTTTAATTGLIIPPSNIMIVYAVVTQQISVAAIFMAGILPGILIGLALMAVCRLLAARQAPTQDIETKVTLGQTLWAAWGAFPSLLLIVIVLAGILGGAFSATEAAAIAVLYAFLLGLIYKHGPLALDFLCGRRHWLELPNTLAGLVRHSTLPQLLLKSGITTAVIFLLIGTSQAMSWVLAYQNIPQSVSASLLGLSENPYVILLVINLLLLFVGTFMDMTPAVLIFTPIFLPVVTQLGVDPVQFGIIMIANLCIGLCTPPVGTCLFVGCGVGKTSIAKVTRPMIPFFIAMLLTLMAITYWPALSMWLPRELGLL